MISNGNTTSSLLPIEYSAEYLSLTAITIQRFDSLGHVRIPHIVTGYPAGRFLGLSSQFYLSVAADLSVFVSVLCSSALSNRNFLAISGCLMMLLFTLLVIGMGAIADIRSGILECKRRIKERLRDEKKSEESAEQEEQDENHDDQDEDQENTWDMDESSREECMQSPRPITDCNSYSGPSPRTFGINHFNWYSLGFDDIHDISHCYRHLDTLLDGVYRSSVGFLGLMYNSSADSVSVTWMDQLPEKTGSIRSNQTESIKTQAYAPDNWNYTWVNTEFKSITNYRSDIYQDIYRIFTNGTQIFSDRPEQRFCFCNSVDNENYFSRNVLIDMSFGSSNSFVSSPCSIEDCIG